MSNALVNQTYDVLERWGAVPIHPRGPRVAGVRGPAPIKEVKVVPAGDFGETGVWIAWIESTGKSGALPLLLHAIETAASELGIPPEEIGVALEPVDTGLVAYYGELGFETIDYDDAYEFYGRADPDFVQMRAQLDWLLDPTSLPRHVLPLTQQHRGERNALKRRLMR